MYFLAVSFNIGLSGFGGIMTGTSFVTNKANTMNISTIIAIVLIGRVIFSNKTSAGGATTGAGAATSGLSATGGAAGTVVLIVSVLGVDVALLLYTSSATTS